MSDKTESPVQELARLHLAACNLALHWGQKFRDECSAEYPPDSRVRVWGDVWRVTRWRNDAWKPRCVLARTGDDGKYIERETDWYELERLGHKVTNEIAKK